MKTKDTIVVVGTGIAGATAAQTLRSEGFDGNVVVVGAEGSLPYRRPMVSKDFLFATPPSAAKALVAPAEFWCDNRIDVRTATAATGLDTDSRTIELDDGTSIRYDAALLATGATADRFGSGRRVQTLRTLDDAARLHRSLRAGAALLIIGGGLIGCEVAAAARYRGVDVTVLESTKSTMSRILPADIASAYADMHVTNGVVIETGVELESLRDNGSGVAATAGDGRVWRADSALVAIGATPNVALAQGAGLEIGDGIVVDDSFTTSAPGVYAAGDVASVPNPLVGRHRGQHWNSARGQGENAAKSILGHSVTSFEVPWGWSTQYGRTLDFAGWPTIDDDIAIDGTVDDLDFLALARRDARIVGAIGCARPTAFRRARTVITVEALVGAHRRTDLVFRKQSRTESSSPHNGVAARNCS